MYREAHSAPPSPVRTRRRSRSLSPFHRDCCPSELAPSEARTVVHGLNYMVRGQYALSKSMPDLRPRFLVKRADGKLISERNFCGMIDIHEDHLKRVKEREASRRGTEGDHHTIRSGHTCGIEGGRGPTNRSNKQGMEECPWTESGYSTRFGTEDGRGVKNGRGNRSEYGHSVKSGHGTEDGRSVKGGRGNKSEYHGTEGKDKPAMKKFEPHWEPSAPPEQSQSSPCLRLPTSKEKGSPQWTPPREHVQPREQFQPLKEYVQSPREQFQQPPVANNTGLRQSPSQSPQHHAVKSILRWSPEPPRSQPAPTPTPVPIPVVDPEMLNRYLPKSETYQNSAKTYLPRSETYEKRTLAATIEEKIEKLRQECCVFLVSFNILYLVLLFVL